ncbi:MAG TPA: galactokinase family protein [Clostridia bacterium]|nr:galactokinase family protein [Clostridia bacterium]
MTETERAQRLKDKLKRAYPEARGLRCFSAGGRIELSGNHTDHQHGRVLAAAIEQSAVMAAFPADDGCITIHSEGYKPFTVSLDAPKEGLSGSTAALVLGVADGLLKRGYRVGGFCAVMDCEVRKGSGLSSSAAIEVLFGAAFNYLYNGGKIAPMELAKVGQYAENVWFGKPCGLLDQAACAHGGCVEMDFIDPSSPLVTPVSLDCVRESYEICVVYAGGDHSDLTDCYSAIVAELAQVSRFFGKSVLRQIPKDEFMDSLPALSEAVPHRAILRALHVYDENERVLAQCAALRRGDSLGFLRLVNASGDSSFMLLQNVCPDSIPDRSLALALALTREFLDGQGACRVHGGGFMGTILAFIPKARFAQYREFMEGVFGKGSVDAVSIRAQGGTELKS